MPKYTPTLDDMYNVKPCFICGRDAIDSDTCSDICAQQWQIFEDDYEWLQLKASDEWFEQYGI